MLDSGERQRGFGQRHYDVATFVPALAWRCLALPKLQLSASLLVSSSLSMLFTSELALASAVTAMVLNGATT